MKPHRFDYHAPESLEGATSLFDQYGDDAKALAGGQSLMPLVNMRLAQPEVIVDLNRVASMAYVEESPHGGLRVGAMTRVRTLERLSGLRDTAPLLAAAPSAAASPTPTPPPSFPPSPSHLARNSWLRARGVSAFSRRRSSSRPTSRLSWSPPSY